MKTATLWVVGVIVTLAVIAGIVFGGWQLGWWFKTQNTNRAAHLYQHQYGRQQSLLDDMSHKLGSVTDITAQLNEPSVPREEAAALNAQRLAVARQVCEDAALLNTTNELAPDQQSWVQLNCAYGDVSASSPLRTP